MNLIYKETLNAMGQIEEVSPNTISSIFNFPADFTGFQGHFSNQPVLPAICILETIKALLCQWSKMNYIISEVKNAKFFNPIGALESITVTLSLGKADAESQELTAIVANEKEKKSKIKIIFRKS